LSEIKADRSFNSRSWINPKLKYSIILNPKMKGLKLFLLDPGRAIG
jgi:hypothetical protein